MKEIVIVACENDQLPLWTFREWDPLSGSLIHTHSGDPCTSNGLVCSSPNRNVYSTSSKRSFVQLSLIGSLKKNDFNAVCSDRIDTLALSMRSSNQLLSISSDCSIQLWELASGWKSKDLVGHYQSVTKLVFAGNDRLMISGGKDSLILVWDVCEIMNAFDVVTPTFSLTHHSMPITDIYSCGPSSPFLVWTCSLDRTCQLFDANTGCVKIKLDISATPLSICCSPAIKELYSGCNDGSIRIMCRKEMMQFISDTTKPDVLHGHKAPVSCLSISMCGNILASGGMDKQVCLWDIYKRCCLRLLNQPGAVLSVNFFSYYEPDEKELAIPSIFTKTVEEINLVQLPEIPKETHFKKIRLWDMINQEKDDKESMFSKLQDEISRLRRINVNLLSSNLSKITD